MVIRIFACITLMLLAAPAGVRGQTVTLNGATQPNLWLKDDAGSLKSEAVLSITSDRSMPAWVRISVPGEAPYMESLGNLAVGANNPVVHVLELTAATANVGFQVFADAQGTGTPLASRTVAQKRIRRWKMYVANDCHVDIGYTDYQENLKKISFPGFLDDAFTRIQATAAWPVESRFTYPIESSFMIYDAAMIARNADWMETLKGHLRSGRMSYPASYFNYTFETMGTEELARSNYISMRHLPDMLGIGPNRAGYMTDNPGLSWSAVDALLEAGIKAYHLRFNDDRSWSLWDIGKYPRMFYLQGRKPGNKLLVWNGPHYGRENMPIGPNFGFLGDNSEACYNQVMAWFAKLEKDGWAYDAWLSTFTEGGDNLGIHPNPILRVKGVNDLIAAKGYAYPKIIFSNNGDFFEHILADYSQAVPTFKGHIESWWNLGVPSTANETGRNNEAQDKLAAAETFATFAHLSVDGIGYPYPRLELGWKNLLTWDEHTWGSAARGVDNQWFWKRNAALIAAGTADEVLQKSLKALASRLATAGWTLTVYNSLSWERDDFVTVAMADLPKHFDIMDAGTGKPVKYQKLEDGTVQFLAEKVPGLGYKTYQVGIRTSEPAFTGSIRYTANTLENDFFKVAFDAAGGVSSIQDKRSGNRELVDPTAPVRLNQLQVNANGFVTAAALHAKVGALRGEMAADGFAGAQGIESMQRRVILYDGIPRIDIVNEVLKAPGGDAWDFHFTFPFNVNDFTLRQEMPTGSFMPYVSADIRDPRSEQLYTSATDQYAVNRWIDISSTQGYGVTFCPLTAPMVSYGDRRASRWDVNYNHKNPWIWSMIYNNHWFTNFQATQPGRTVFRYSLRPHAGQDWVESGAARFGAEQASPLYAVVVSHPQAGSLAGMGHFLAIDKPNVVLTTAKTAEANGEGIILRFNEVSGSDTRVTVDLAWLNPSQAMETDLVENDRGPLALDSSKLSLDIDGHGWKTIRIRRGAAPAPVSNLKATGLADGCRISWDSLADAKVGYYEVFRSTQRDFESGTGSYLGSTERNWFFDRQATPGLTRAYHYRVRAAAGGLKGASSASVQMTAGTYSDKRAPTVPDLIRVERMHGTRSSLEWKPSEDDKYVTGYDIYRDGLKIATVDAILNSHLDVTSTAWANMPYYQVVAFDSAGNRSASGKAMTSGPTLPDWLNLAPQAAVSVSSEFDAAHGKENLFDGVFGKQDAGEWASSGEANPWIRFDWKAPQAVRAVVLYDRSNALENGNGGTLTFSDGSSLKVLGLPTWGEGKLIAFPWKEVAWVKFQVEGGQGPNGGLAEMAVLGDDRVPVSVLSPQGPQKDARAWKTAQGQGGVANSNGGRKKIVP